MQIENYGGFWFRIQRKFNLYSIRMERTLIEKLFPKLSNKLKNIVSRTIRTKLILNNKQHIEKINDNL
jgi:hypothetical protein